MNGHDYMGEFWVSSHWGLWPIVIGTLVWWLAFGWPVARILHRMGFSRIWVLLCFVPLGNIIGLWVLSSTRWPRIERD